MKAHPENPCASKIALVEGKRPTITVGQFYKEHGEALQLSLVGNERGFDRKILEPTINRPGLFFFFF